ncbi:nucleotide sugar dehydrogenase [Nereida sp. MMG025]|uniref:nucleotide sugar dehydrogenase n=1 Tax=Nereida sp. MMG025 TaxID=2909981 RepID=UPI001F00A8FD|nr:nucleotide sugar dehydrogenase [Nereida sp. MMG025]MCF6445724.1 nucleotide sugar dehydrogenase [Nereida sp. MMG025]
MHQRAEHHLRVAVVGLGYVGLPVAVRFGQKKQTLGFDIDTQRIAELRNGIDRTNEITADELGAASELTFSDQEQDLAAANFYIVTVPTPINSAKAPDLGPLRSASELVGRAIAPGDFVVYESTVYPGATEEYCVPILERASGLKLNEDFFVGYSPERINPGDPSRGIADIVKVTSGSTPQAAAFVDETYRSIISAGTHLAPSIEVAEAAKVIENTQRDLNIALVNEFSMIFDRLNINTYDVLAAAGTKWNFLNFTPGLVGGHCIGVDPYYLAYKAEQAGHHPEIILAGRRINSRMADHVASKLVKAMIGKGLGIRGQRVLVLGLTFKENCPDVRNTKVVDLIGSLKEFGLDVDVFDPWVEPETAHQEFGIELLDSLQPDAYEAIVLAVPHADFLTSDWQDLCKPLKVGGVVMDLKSVLPEQANAITL